MATFMTKEELLHEVNSGFNALNQGTIDLEQMNDLVDSTRELYERTLIIRHKAQELFVNEQPVSFENDIQPIDYYSESVSFPNGNQVISGHYHDDDEVEAEENESEISDEIANHSTTQPTFSVEEKEDGFAFDLFDIPSENEETIAQRIEEESVFTPNFELEEEPEEETPTFAIEPEAEIVEEIQEQPIAEIIEEQKIHDTDIEMPKSIAEIMNGSPFNFNANVSVEEPIKEEPIKEEEPIALEETTTSSYAVGDISFFNNYPSLSQNPSAMMIAPKIENLTGAFGLGEKLMYIRELFNGSSDAFNHVIAEVEKGQSFDEAKIVLSAFAADNTWDLSNQTTLDFINKVERRFF